MENQHRLISGYRELNEEEITLMNEIKAVGEALGKLHNSIAERLGEQYIDASNRGADDAVETSGAAYEALNIAKQHLQTGIMWLTRAVAQPKGF